LLQLPLGKECLLASGQCEGLPAVPALDRDVFVIHALNLSFDHLMALAIRQFRWRPPSRSFTQKLKRIGDARDVPNRLPTCRTCAESCEPIPDPQGTDDTRVHVGHGD
jgi:hypothetical protein